MAGKAWESNAILIAEFDEADRSDIEHARKIRQEVLDLRSDTATMLTEEQLLRSSMLIAASLTDSSGWFKGVLCIDFRVPSHQRKSLWSRLVAEFQDEKPWRVEKLENNEAFWTSLSFLATQLAANLHPPTPPRLTHVSLAEKDGASLKRILLRSGADLPAVA